MLFFLVGSGGFIYIYKALVLLRALKHGAAGENRTHDPVLTKDVRYHYATAATDNLLTYFDEIVKKKLLF